MKRYLQCAEQPVSSANLTKYCACHAKRLSWWILLTFETLFTMRGTTSAILQHPGILRLPRKMTIMTAPRHIWNVIYNARNNRGYPPTSPNTAPATQKWLSWLILVTYETLFTMRGTTGGILQHDRILRLPGKLTLETFQKIARKQLKRHLQCASDPSRIRPWSEQDPTMKPSPATRLANEVTFHAQRDHFVLKNRTFRAPAIIPHFTEYCACHEKCHLNFTKCCTCQEKWHLNFTKCCACHVKWHLNFTKCCPCHVKWHLRPDDSLLYSSQTNLISSESLFKRIYIIRISFQTNLYLPNLFSNESYLFRVSFSNESYLLRISSQTNLISYSSDVVRISGVSHLNFLW